MSVGLIDMERLVNPELELMDSLSHLISQEFKNHRTVGYYGDLLNVSVTCLNNLTHVYYGRSVHEMLDQKLLECAKYYLSRSSLSVKWMTYELGFQDPGYFSRWFKKLTGESPKDYRKKGSRF